MPSPGPLDLAIQRFLTHLKAARRVSEHTLRAYGADLVEFSRKNPGLAPADVARAQVRAYAADLQKGELARATVLRRLASLKSFLKYLRRQGTLRKDPFAGLPGPRSERRLPRFLTEKEAETLLAAPAAGAIENPRDRAIFELLYSSGLRRSELCGLNRGDVDFMGGFVRVFGKGGRERLVPAGDVALGCLREYLQGRARPQDAMVEPLFVNERGARLTAGGLYWLLRRWTKAMGFAKPVNPHALRHSFATHLINRGSDLRSVQEMLGHADLATTQIYTHLDASALKAAHSKHHPRG